MSVSSHVFLDDANLPTIAEWNAGLKDSGVPLVLEDVGELREFDGYLPAKLDGRDVGFEWSYGPISEVFGDPPEDVETRAHAAEFVTHSDMAELVAAMYAAAIFARITDGLPFDTECDEVTTVDDLLAAAEETAKDI